MYSSIEKDKEEKSSFVGWHRELLVGEKKCRRQDEHGLGVG